MDRFVTKPSGSSSDLLALSAPDPEPNASLEPGAAPVAQEQPESSPHSAPACGYIANYCMWPIVDKVLKDKWVQKSLKTAFIGEGPNPVFDNTAFATKMKSYGKYTGTATSAFSCDPKLLTMQKQKPSMLEIMAFGDKYWGVYLSVS